VSLHATRTSLALLSAALVAVVAGCGGGKSAPKFVGPTLKNPSTAPNFALRDQHGQVVSIDGQRGKVALITFLYTHCPDVCPLTAMNLNTALGLVGAKRKDVVVLAVSVDPRGDTPAAVASFVRSHRLRPQFHYLTGSAQALQRVWRAYNVTAVRQGAGGAKGVDHTLYTLVVDPKGKARVLFDSLATPKSIAHDVGLLLPA
jgi:protein SCO1/2